MHRLFKQLSALQKALNQYGGLISTAFGATGSQLTAGVIAAATAIADTINSDQNTFTQNATTAASALQATDAAFLSLFDLTGSLVPSLTVTSMNGSTTIDTDGSSIVAKSEASSVAGGGEEYVSYYLTDSNGSSGFASALLGQNGAATLTSATQINAGSASQVTQTDDTGQITKQVSVLDGVSIVTTSPALSDINLYTLGNLSLDIPAPTPSEDVSISELSGGAIGVSVGDPQEVLDYPTYNALAGDTIAVENNGGSVDISTDIGPGDTGRIASTVSAPGVVQDVEFNASGDTLDLENPASFVGMISNFLPGDTIQLDGVHASAATISSSDILDVEENNGATIPLQLDPSQDYRNDVVVVAPVWKWYICRPRTYARYLWQSIRHEFRYRCAI